MPEIIVRVRPKHEFGIKFFDTFLLLYNPTISVARKT